MMRVLLLLIALLSGCAGNGTPMSPHIAGEGGPVVVLQSGLGDGAAVWEAVLPDLARDHRVFAYDRTGDGPRDPCSIAADLRARLRAAGLAPPYILVGHSLGGLYQFVLAASIQTR